MKNSIKLSEYIKEEDKEYINIIESIPKLTNEEIKSFNINNIHNDANYRKRIIEANLYRVAKIALKINCEYIDYLDLVEEGNVGLIKAIDSFHYGDYNSFIKSINASICYSIKTAISEKGKIIKLPRYMNANFYKYKKCFDKYVLDNGDIPAIDEMVKIANVTYEQSSIYHNLCFEFLSLEDRNEGYFNHFELLEDFMEDKLMEEEKRRIIYDAINNSNLTDKEKSAIIYRYGLYTNKFEKNTLAKKLNVSNSRVGGLAKNAIKKLRLNKNIQLLLKSVDYVTIKDSANNNLEKRSKYAINIYDFFKEYTKEQVDAVISRLSDKDLEILHKRYDFNYYIIPASKKDINAYYSHLVPKMKKMLENIDSVIYKTDIMKKNIKMKVNGNETINEYEYKIDNKYSYLKNESIVRRILKLLEPEDVTIITLKFGLFNDRCFSIEAISDLFGIEKDLVVSTINNFLEMYNIYTKEIGKCDEVFQKIK